MVLKIAFKEQQVCLGRKNNNAEAWKTVFFLAVVLVIFGYSFNTQSLKTIQTVIKQSVDQQTKSISPSEHEGKSSPLYSWIGNHWIPPAGIPTYNPKEMRSVFQRHNTLFGGDSNCRQDMTTLFAIINNTVTYSSTDSNSSLIPEEEEAIPFSDLSKDMNINKLTITHTCQLRDFSNESVRGRLRDPSKFLCFHVPLLNAKKRQDQMHGKFDMLWAACPPELVEMIEIELAEDSSAATISMLKEYDVLFVDLGIWEVHSTRDCRRERNETESTCDRVEEALNALKTVSSPNLNIFWKTTGGSGSDNDYHRENLKRMNNCVRRWFNMHQPNFLHLVDYELQIRPRTYGRDRIVGDMHPHWGAEARLLTAQLFTHALRVCETSRICRPLSS